jgi:cytoskeleton protein RodZ
MIDAGDIRTSATSGPGVAPNLRLSQAREAQNLTTADVARRLKLSVWQVEALESGQYEQLPGPTFVRGFIRNYARLLNLDPEELVRAVTDLLPAPAPRPESPPSRDIPFPVAGPRRWPRYAVAVAVVVALLAGYEFYFDEGTGTVAPPLPREVAALPAPKEPQPAAPASKPREVVQETQPPAAAAGAPKVAAVEPVKSAPSASPPREGVAHPDARELTFVFDEESWVEIRDRNDQTIHSNLNQAGTTRRVRGLPPLHIVVGNAQGVRMTYNGREIDLARHTKIDVARLTLE